MSFREWYIRFVLNKDLTRAHRSIWNDAKKEISLLSPARKAHLVELWQKHREKIVGDLEEQTKPKEVSAPSILPDGMKIPDGIRGMDELYDQLNLLKSEREKTSKPEKTSNSPTQLSLFGNPNGNSKISTLLKALKKVSRA